ncbi:MAG: hypothetical protein ABJF88_03810 [Rhodothermales bacterium]
MPAMIATKSRTGYAAALFLLVGLAAAGCDHVTDAEGPNLTDRFGDFFVVDSLMASQEEVDFAAGEFVTFTAQFNKQVAWVLEITGQESGAVKRIEGFSNELSAENARWNGGTTDLPLFKTEVADAVLLIDDENADTLRTTVEVVTPRAYDVTVIADFEQASPSIMIGNFEFEFDLTATGRSAEVPPAQGDFFYLLRSTGGPVVADPFFIGLISINASITGETYFPVPTTVPEDLFFNAFLYSFGSPNTIAVVQLAVDTNGSGAYEDGQDATFSILDQPIEGEGWQAFSAPLSATAITQAQTEEIVAIRVLLISDDNGQPTPPLPVDFGIDYLNFTTGGPLQL